MGSAGQNALGAGPNEFGQWRWLFTLARSPKDAVCNGMSFGVAETVSQIPEASSQAQGAPMLAVGKVSLWALICVLCNLVYLLDAASDGEPCKFFKPSKLVISYECFSHDPLGIDCRRCAAQPPLDCGPSC